MCAVRNRVRYAFKHSVHADSLQRKYRLEDILKSVKKARAEADGNAAGEEQAVATANRSSYLSASTMAILYLRTRRRAPRCLNIE